MAVTLPTGAARSSWRLLSILLLLLCTTTTPATAADEGAGNVIVNGQFSDSARFWWGPGWRVVTGAGPDGHTALQISGGYAAQDKRPVQGGQAYKVSVRVRGEDAAPGSIYVQVSFRGPGVSPGWHGNDVIRIEGRAESAVISGSASPVWQTLSGIVNAPANATEILVYLRKLPGSQGSAFFHDVVVRAIGPANESAPATIATRERLVRKLYAASDGTASIAEGATTTTVTLATRGTTPPLLRWAEDGKALARIYTPRSSDPITLHAAEELAEYLGRMSDASFLPLVDAAPAADAPLIIVGRHALTDRLFPGIPYSELGDDGFVIRTAGRVTMVAGGTPRGTLYGVNWLLDRKLGVRWLAPNATYVPRRLTLDVPAINEQQTPRFRYREVLSAEAEDKQFRVHNLLNGESHGPSFSPSLPEIDSWDHSWAAKGGTATFHELLPPSIYAKAHPEWFHGGQLAMMNAEVRKLIAGAVIERLKLLPDYKAVWFIINDMDWGWDMDSDSKAFADAHGGQPAAPRLDMVVDVANRVRTVLPGARLGFNAYHWSFTPPVGMTVPDYVMVFPMTIHVDYSTALNQGRNTKLGEDIAAWSSMAKHVLIWDHVANFAGLIQPTPNIYPIGDSIRWLANLPNVEGYFAESSWFTPGGEFSSLRAWLIARLLWDPQQDPRALVQEYCHTYFGAAAGPIVQYIDLMHSAIALSGDLLAEKTQPDLRMFDIRFVNTADRIFDEAEHAVEGDVTLLTRVRAARMPVDYIALVRRTDLKRQARTTGTQWAVETEKRLLRIRSAAQTVKLSKYRQDGPINALYELLAIERTEPPPPSIVNGRAPTDWALYQELSFNQYDSARIVGDPKASDGAALRMSGKSSTWAAQFKFDKLPSAGRWDLYVSVRADADAIPDSKAILRVGSYPPMNLSNEVSFGQLNDGQYHYIKVPGGPFQHIEDHGSGVYVQAVNVPGAQHVYVDAILAVRNGNSIY